MEASPLKRLIESTKSMKQGLYPTPIEIMSVDKMGQLMGQFNDLVQQLIILQKGLDEKEKYLYSELSTLCVALAAPTVFTTGIIAIGFYLIFQFVYFFITRTIYMRKTLQNQS